MLSIYSEADFTKEFLNVAMINHKTRCKSDSGYLLSTLLASLPSVP